MKDNLHSASRYLIKYIIKDLNNSKFIYITRLLDGLKRKNKIRAFSSTILPLTVGVYKKIYFVLQHLDLKEKILQECKYKKIPIYLYIQDNLYLRKTVSKSDGSNVVKEFGGRNSLFKANFDYKKEGKDFKLVDFTIKYKSKIISKKQSYLKFSIQGG